MIQNLPVELRHEILRYIIPDGHHQTTTLHLSDHRFQRNKFRYGRPNPQQSEKFTYIFRVSRQFLHDAAYIYYGSRTFHLEYGLRHQRDQSSNPNGVKGDVLKTDSLSLFPAYAMKAVQRLHILIRDDVRDAASHRRVRNALERFVGKVGGGHSLVELRVALSNVERFWDYFLKLPSASCYKHRFEAPLTEGECLRYGYVLEPLVGLHGVKDVRISGINPEFDRKLERVLSSSEAVSLMQSSDRTPPAVQGVTQRLSRKGKGGRIAKGTSRQKRRFYEPIYDWTFV